jgi:hypothetical protein
MSGKARDAPCCLSGMGALPGRRGEDTRAESTQPLAGGEIVCTSPSSAPRQCPLAVQVNDRSNRPCGRRTTRPSTLFSWGIEHSLARVRLPAWWLRVGSRVFVKATWRSRSSRGGERLTGHGLLPSLMVRCGSVYAQTETEPGNKSAGLDKGQHAASNGGGCPNHTGAVPGRTVSYLTSLSIRARGRALIRSR